MIKSFLAIGIGKLLILYFEQSEKISISICPEIFLAASISIKVVTLLPFIFLDSMPCTSLM